MSVESIEVCLHEHVLIESGLYSNNQNQRARLCAMYTFEWVGKASYR